jgi:uncharacterized protein YjbJ (UPF0337 family)
MNRDSESDIYSQTTNWLVGTAKRNPEGLLLLAAGCALLLRSKSSRTPSMRSDSSVQRAQDGVSRAVGDATTYAADIKKKVSDTVNQATESVSDMAGDATRAVSDQSQRFARNAQSTFDSTMSRVLREQPLAVAMVGLAAGAAFAAVVPTTDVEKRTLGAAGEAISDAAGKARDTVMEAAGKAGERLKSGAEERGLSTQGLKELAGEVTDAFKSSVSGKADDLHAATTVPEPGVSKPDAVKESALVGSKDRGGASPSSGFDRGGSNPSSGFGAGAKRS